MTSRTVCRPRIVARMLLLTTSGAFVVLLTVLLSLWMLGNTARGQEAEQVFSNLEAELLAQAQANLNARAAQIEARLRISSTAVLSLADYAEEVLLAPETYSTVHRRPIAAVGSPPPAGLPDKQAQTESAVGSGGIVAGKIVDSPAYYSVAGGGALRKVLDDGNAAVFYQRRPEGHPFSATEMNKVYATATLDPFLKSICRSEPMCSAAYLLTEDNLLRTFPFIDTSAWQADRELTGLAMYAFSHDKANSEGVVWTGPYVSSISRKWVVACLSGVMIRGKKAGVCGAEYQLDKMSTELLEFAVPQGIGSWLQTGDGILLSSQSGVDAVLRVIPLAKADMPSKNNPDKKIKLASNLGSSSAPEIAELQDKSAEDAAAFSSLGSEFPGRYAALASLSSVGWRLGSLIESPAIIEAAASRRVAGNKLKAQLPLLIGIPLIGLTLIVLLVYLESRRISQALMILAQRLRKLHATRSAVSLSIADDGEIGSLAETCQELFDSLTQPERSQAD